MNTTQTLEDLGAPVAEFGLQAALFLQRLSTELYSTRRLQSQEIFIYQCYCQFWTSVKVSYRSKHCWKTLSPMHIFASSSYLVPYYQLGWFFPGYTSGEEIGKSMRTAYCMALESSWEYRSQENFSLALDVRWPKVCERLPLHQQRRVLRASCRESSSTSREKRA